MEQITKVTLAKGRGTVDEKVYGQFIEHLQDCINGGVYDPKSRFADENGVRTDVRELARRLAPPILRFPGGTVMCLYHWEDAVGPMEKRIRRKNLIWGGEIDPSFGTAEFVRYCREIGAEPMICVNMASGTPEEAGNWVEYCNGTGDSYYAALRRSHGYEEPFNVKYWCIGNECYAEPDIGIQNDVSVYIRDAREFIKFMKLTDKTIKTVLVGSDDPAWNKAVLDALSPMTDYLSLHHYSAENGKGIYGPFEGEKQLFSMLEDASRLIEQYPEKVTDFNQWYRFPPREAAVQIAVDEWNIWNADDSETYGLDARFNWRDAVWVAGALNILLSNPHVGIANMAQMVNVIAPIVTQPEGSFFQTIAYPFLLYRENMAGERLEVSHEPVMIDGGAAEPLDALHFSALRGADGTARIAAVNRDFSAAHTIAVETACGQCGITELTAPSWDSVCTLEACCVEKKEKTADPAHITLAPGSVSLIVLK